MIGKNTAAEFGKDIAKVLNLPNPGRYTGHCWRATSLTWAANAGLSVNQMKSISGHQSDSVIEGYIRNSTFMKHTTSAALALDSELETSATTPSAVTTTLGKRPADVPCNDSGVSSSSAQPVSGVGPAVSYNFAGAVINAPVNFTTTSSF